MRDGALDVPYHAMRISWWHGLTALCVMLASVGVFGGFSYVVQERTPVPPISSAQASQCCGSSSILGARRSRPLPVS